MKIWYKAVCDEHKECINIFVDTPSRTALYLSEHDQDIYMHGYYYIVVVNYE